jgi:hypothetical protein
MLATVLQLKILLVMVRLCSSRAQSIEVLSHYGEIEYSCWILAE